MDLNALSDAVIDGDDVLAAGLTGQALAEGLRPLEIIQGGLVPGISVVGEKFRAMEMFLTEMLIAARAMHASMDVLKPHMTVADSQPRGTVVIGTAKGDLHDIGKRLVGIMLECQGFRVVDLGVDVPAERFLQKAQAEGAQIIAVSALLTTTMWDMRKTVDAVEEAGLRGRIKVMVGGAPVTQAYADEIGADGYARDAVTAAEIAAKLVAAPVTP